MVFALVSMLAGLTVLYVNSHGPLQTTKIVLLPKPSSIKSIARKLHKEGVINYPVMFRIAAYIASRYGSLKAGEYEFKTAITPKQVIRMLIDGHYVVHSITIPEGLTVKQIIDLVNNEPLLVGTINPNLKEGTLFPDTYFYCYGDKRQVIINHMRNRMQLIVNELWEKRAPDLPIATKDEAVTLASIIEKETGINNEYKRISAVFVNRLKKGMKLQADPTTIYAVTSGSGELNRPLTKSDLKFQSKYNTYVAEGLPPGPISNPGRAAIEAALNPIKSNELFFVVNGKGGHSFATNLKEHNLNVNEYRKGSNNKN